jgi:membrane protease YdiL (CAAX protease family)
MLLATRKKGSGSFVVDFGLVFERARDLGGVLIGVGTQIVVVPLLYVPFAYFIKDLSDRLEAPARSLTNQAGGDVALAILGVLVVVGAPIVVELFYRGLLLRSIENRFGPNIAIGLSALGFAAAHGELLQFPALLVFGVILGVLAVRTGRLGPGIFAHAGFNAVTMAVLVATRH